MTYRSLTPVLIAVFTALALNPAASVPLPKLRPGSVALEKPVAPAPAPATAEPVLHPDRLALRSPPPRPPLPPILQPPKRRSPPRASATSPLPATCRTIADPLARKLVEWAILRSDDSESIELGRYTAFLSENPSWPAIALLRRRAEAALWSDRPDPIAVRSFFGKDRPTTAKGKFAARALLLQGDRSAAQALIRDAWRNDAFGNDLEGPALDIFNDLITAADHKARMDARLYAETGWRLALRDRARGNAPAIAKARIAVIKKAANGKALLDALPAEAQRDIGCIFSRVQLLRRAEKATEAADVILSVPQDHGQGFNAAIDADQWWMERRAIARKLLDLGDAKELPCGARGRAAGQGEFSRRAAVYRRLDCVRSLRDPGALRILPGSAKAPTIPSRSPAPVIGRGARPKPWDARTRRARISRRRRTIPLPITGRSRGHGSATRISSCARRRRRRPIAAIPLAAGSRARNELLYAIDERDLIAGSLADLGERSADAVALAALGTSRASTRMPAPCSSSARRRSRVACRLSTMPFRLSASLTIVRSDRRLTGHRLCHRPSGKHVRSERVSERARHGADAGDTCRRPPRRD